MIDWPFLIVTFYFELFDISLAAVEKDRSLIAFMPLLSVPLGISVAAVGMKKFYETKASIMRKLLKDAEADLVQLRKGKEKGLRKGEEQIWDPALSSVCCFSSPAHTRTHCCFDDSCSADANQS